MSEAFDVDEGGDPDNYTTVRFRLLNANYDKLFSVAALKGENMEDVLNRAVALYEILHRAKPGEIVKWVDRSGNRRKVAVLPAKIALPWPFRWLSHHVDAD